MTDGPDSGARPVQRSALTRAAAEIGVNRIAAENEYAERQTEEQGQWKGTAAHPEFLCGDRKTEQSACAPDDPVSVAVVNETKNQNPFTSCGYVAATQLSSGLWSCHSPRPRPASEQFEGMRMARRPRYGIVSGIPNPQLTKLGKV